MEKMCTILDLRKDQRYMCIATQPQDLEVRIRKGARGAYRIKMEPSPSGHLLIPCSEYTFAKQSEHSAFKVENQE